MVLGAEKWRKNDGFIGGEMGGVDDSLMVEKLGCQWRMDDDGVVCFQVLLQVATWIGEVEEEGGRDGLWWCFWVGGAVWWWRIEDDEDVKGGA